MIAWKRDERGRRSEGRRGEAAAGKRVSTATLETDDVRGCQCEVIDCRPLSLALLLTLSTTG